MKRYIVALMFGLLLFPLLRAHAADIPFIMNYQGSVKTATGAVINGNGYFKFAIVNSDGTITHWSNDNTSSAGSEPTDAVTIPVSNGLFSVKLGDTTLTNMTSALSATIFANTNTFLRVWFSDDNATFAQLSPDSQLVSAAYAFKAQNVESLEGSTGGAITGNISATGSVIATGTGLTLSCVNKSLSYSLGTASSVDLRINSGAGTDTTTTLYCGAGYEIFQTLCWGGNYPADIRLAASGTYGAIGQGICVFYNEHATLSRLVYLYGHCCKGNW